MCFLIVDDSTTMRRIIINTLNKLGHQDVAEAGNGKEGLDRLSAGPVDLIITDWNMPEMSGIDFIRTVRSMPEIKDTPQSSVLGIRIPNPESRIPNPESRIPNPGCGYTGSMQLRSARLCLDCDEVHDAQQCPQCASETFVFITRWIQIPDRPDRPKKRVPAAETSSTETLGAYREMLQPEPKAGGGWRTVRRGALGLALFGIAGWMWRQNTRPSDGDAQTSDDETTKPRG